MIARIQVLCDMFPRGSNLIDIGSDHGYLGIELINQDKVMHIYNVDLSKSAINRSKKIYEKFDLLSRAEFICGDGFKSIKKIPDNSVVVIAGMGSAQILKILSFLPENIRHLIFLSHTEYFMIRKWANENHWIIQKEKYFEDNGFFYLSMSMIRSFGKREHYSMSDYIFGKDRFWINNMDMFKKYWKNRSLRILKIPFKYRTDEEKFSISLLEKMGIIDSETIVTYRNG